MEVVERVIKMEKDIEYIKKGQAKLELNIDQSNQSVDEKFDKIIDHIDTKFDALPTKFAGKYIENAFWWFLSTVFLALIYYFTGD